MILDKQNLFSEDQAVTVSAASTNVIDLGTDASETPTPNLKDAMLFAQVTTAFADGTSMSVALQTDSDEAFGSAETIFTSAAIATSALVAGYQFKLGSLPEGLERYVRLYYTVDGTMTAGEVMAGLVLDKQTKQ